MSRWDRILDATVWTMAGSVVAVTTIGLWVLLIASIMLIWGCNEPQGEVTMTAEQIQQAVVTGVKQGFAEVNIGQVSVGSGDRTSGDNDPWTFRIMAFFLGGGSLGAILGAVVYIRRNSAKRKDAERKALVCKATLRDGAERAKHPADKQTEDQ